MLITTKRLKDETYWCRECDKDISKEEVNTENWECDTCNSKLLIDIGIKNKQMLVRILPSEMTSNDDVYDSYSGSFHSLKGINYDDDKEVYKLGVAGYRMVEVEEDDFVNCRWIGQ